MLKIKTFFIAAIATLFVGSAMAETISMGITGSIVGYEANGEEKLKSSAKITTASETGAAPVASLFIEVDNGDGIIGLDIIPYGAKIGDGSTTDTATGDKAAADNTVDVNFNKAVMLYVETPADIPLISNYGTTYMKFGVQALTLETDENLGTGSTYEDETMVGVHFGVGTKGDLGDGFYKVDLMVARYNGAEFAGSLDADGVGNTITLDDLTTAALRFSVGRSF